MRKGLILLGLAVILIGALTGCGGSKEQAKAEPVKLTVSAAASMRNALEEVKTVYAGQQPGVNVTYNFAASGQLQKQI